MQYGVQVHLLIPHGTVDDFGASPASVEDLFPKETPTISRSSIKLPIPLRQVIPLDIQGQHRIGRIAEVRTEAPGWTTGI